MSLRVGRVSKGEYEGCYVSITQQEYDEIYPSRTYLKQRFK